MLSKRLFLSVYGGTIKKIKKIENSQCTNDKEINIAFDIKMK